MPDDLEIGDGEAMESAQWGGRVGAHVVWRWAAKHPELVAALNKVACTLV